MRLLLKPQTIAASARVARLQQPRVFHAQIRRASTDPEKTDRPYGQPERRDPYGLPDLPEHGLPEHGMRPRQLPGTNTAPLGIAILCCSIVAAYWATTSEIEAYENLGKTPPPPPVQTHPKSHH